MGEVGRESSHHWVTIYFQKPISDACIAVDSIVAYIVVLWNLQALWLCWVLHKVLETFNRHLNRKREFTMITRKTLHDHFWCSIWKFDPLFSIIYYYLLLVICNNSLCINCIVSGKNAWTCWANNFRACSGIVLKCIHIFITHEANSALQEYIQDIVLHTYVSHEALNCCLFAG